MTAAALKLNPTEIPAATPAMQQYLDAKAQYPDCLLFYRMGDFYELFFDDAVQAAAILDIALTKRGQHGGEEVPMCGVPVHSHEGYLEKLIASGEKVAVCEQMETPEEAKKRGHKAVMRREVVRVITPGTITEERLLEARAANFLAAIAVVGAEASLAWVDISTGEFGLQSVLAAGLQEEVLRLNPSELLLADGFDGKTLSEAGLRLTYQPAAMFSPPKGEALLKSQFKLTALESLGSLAKADLAACAALLEYLHLTQKGAMPRLNLPRRLAMSDFLAIDPATARNLELTHALGGGRKGSLLHAIDETVTAAGGRLLARRLMQPLTEPSRIAKRLDHVEYFAENGILRAELRHILKTVPDLERCLSRLCLDRGGPRDLLAVLRSLEAAQKLRILLANQPSPEIAGALSTSPSGRGESALQDLLERALLPEPPLLARDGGFIKPGFHAALDEFKILRDESRRHIAGLQQKYQQETGITSLKIKHNNVLGYFVEISANHAGKMREPFFHRQTLASAMRYASPELAELEHKISEAAGRALKIELEIYDQLVEAVREKATDLSLTAQTLAGLDVASALADLAVKGDYCRPSVTSGQEFAIEAGRHPVVEKMLKRDGQSFIANDCTLEDSRRLWLLTGPNMAGKSTFLRQNALIAILAQMGSFVPAKAAKIGVVDRLFSRVGAADDLARGRSTFMVEMVETATILTQATEKSLVILDEIGRGTATYDGLAIAWAVVEHLHDATGCRGLFATHYHELTQLCGIRHEASGIREAQTLAALASYHLKVKEWKNEVIFLHTVAEGAADRSYGIHVAQLAGLPAAVTQRASALLKRFESEGSAMPRPAGFSEPLPLFAHAAPPPPSALEKELALLNPDELTPKEALEMLYRLKKL